MKTELAGNWLPGKLLRSAAVVRLLWVEAVSIPSIHGSTRVDARPPLGLDLYILTIEWLPGLAI